MKPEESYFAKNSFAKISSETKKEIEKREKESRAKTLEEILESSESEEDRYD